MDDGQRPVEQQAGGDACRVWQHCLFSGLLNQVRPEAFVEDQKECTAAQRLQGAALPTGPRRQQGSSDPGWAGKDAVDTRNCETPAASAIRAPSELLLDSMFKGGTESAG